MQSEQTNEIAGALAKAQSQMSLATFNKTNPHFKNRYADLAAIITAVKKPLSDNGISITQITQLDPDRFVLVTTLHHTSGQWIRSEYPLPQNVTPQQLGSALTYARRYSLSSIACIAADEDDDGEDSGDKPRASTETGPHSLPVPMLPDNSGSDWRAFATSLLATVKGCDADEGLLWKKANASALKEMSLRVPKMHLNLINAAGWGASDA